MDARRNAAALAALIVCGCVQVGPTVTSTLGGAPPTEKREVLVSAWHRALVLGSQRTYTPFEGSGPVADPAAGRLFLGTSTGRFYALRSEDGQEIWSYDTGESIHCVPTLSDDAKTIYFGNEAGELWALDTATGDVRWRYEATAELRGAPLVHEQIVVVRDIRGKVHAVDGRDGKGLWLYLYEQPEGYTISSTAGVALAAGRVLTGFSDGTAVGIRLLDGTESWRADLSEFMPGDPLLGADKYDVNTTPVVLDSGTVLFSSYKGGLFALDPTSGAIEWRRGDLDHVSGLTVADGSIYAARASDGIAALNLDGDTFWHSSFTSGTMSPPVVYGDRVFVADSKSGLVVLDRTIGRYLDRYTPAWGATSRPLVVGDRAFLYTNGGHLFTFHLDHDLYE
jgi:outer membrane protein assembly factor BamB